MADNPKYPIFTLCRTELETCNYSRRCFMTGHYCSKQDQVQKERNKLRDKNTVNAFVVMNFSNVSDIVYKWRIQPFIESLSKHLYYNKSKNRLYCINRLPYEKMESNNSASHSISTTALKQIAKDENLTNEETEKLGQQLDRPWEDRKALVDDPLIPVSHINVIRADTNPSTSFVVCNGICQQLQIADLIIVDVSVKNANVFYELGMAVALGKMILPICFSDTYYKMKKPESLKDTESKLEHHIDCYPWRRDLFEHFGIRYRNTDPEYAKAIKMLRTQPGEPVSQTTYKNIAITQYIKQAEAFDKQNGFSDIKYSEFPYQEMIPLPKVFQSFFFGEDKHSEYAIGQLIYRRLQNSYNRASHEENTLVIYTIDGILNEWQAALCIVNYYNTIVRPFFKMHCFCGERVGVLLQIDTMPEDPKDGEDTLHYNIGQIIQIGMNQATYRAHMEMVKPNDFLLPSISASDLLADSNCENIAQIELWMDNLKKSTKEFLRNRCIPILPDKPVYVKRIKDGLQQDIFDDFEIDSTNYPNKKQAAGWFFCLYHVMLRTLRYTNEIVVDIGTNSVQSFFWLGAAHGSNTSAITVRHEKNDWEKTHSEKPAKKSRRIFDVAGLWTAVYHTDNTEKFFEQLTRAQSGIEHYSKLMLQEREKYNEQLMSFFWTSPPDLDGISKSANAKEAEEDSILESFYRNRFWRPILQYNRLHIYTLQNNDIEESLRNGRNALKWEHDAEALLSGYLSQKKSLNEYKVISIHDYLSQDTTGVNSIIIRHTCGSQKMLNPESAQLVFNRNDGTNTFTVEIAGDSSLSALALTSVFVNDQIKSDVFLSKSCTMNKQKNHNKNANNSERSIQYPLLYLQETIEKEILSEYEKRLRKSLEKQFGLSNRATSANTTSEIMKIANHHYINRVIYSTKIYLSTVLYRYFFPFITPTDLERICSGMGMYIASLKAGNRSPFVLNYPKNVYDSFDYVVSNENVDHTIESVHKVLREVIVGLNRVQVSYDVTLMQSLDQDGVCDNQIESIYQSKSQKLKCDWKKTTQNSKHTNVAQDKSLSPIS